MYLVDTNVLSESTRKQPSSRVLAWLEVQTMLIASVVSLHEIEYGIRSAPRSRQAVLRRWFDALVSGGALEFLPIDESVALAAAQLRHERRQQGKAITAADLYIAATARVTGRVLVTRNEKDFEALSLAILNPFET